LPWRFQFHQLFSELAFDGALMPIGFCSEVPRGLYGEMPYWNTAHRGLLTVI